jgi:hypothetical protein
LEDGIYCLLAVAIALTSHHNHVSQARKQQHLLERRPHLDHRPSRLRHDASHIDEAVDHAGKGDLPCGYASLTKAVVEGDRFIA